MIVYATIPSNGPDDSAEHCSCAYRTPTHTLTPPSGDEAFTRTETRVQVSGGQRKKYVANVNPGCPDVTDTIPTRYCPEFC